VGLPEDALRRSLARARDRELGETLVREGRIDPERLERALEDDDGRPLLERLGLSGEPDEVRIAREKPDGVVGGYVLVERIGAGAASEVWRAWDPAAARWVAIKTLQGAQHAQEPLERWRREVLAAGRLTHPNIVPVHGAGEHRGRPWICMAYVRGATFEDRPPSRDDAVRLMRSVALAVHHAHEHGVVHRDLKPANLLLDESGQPWVCDFGIARIFDAPRLTASGTLIGTAPYMSPERAAGKDSGVAADVYGLGATLYTLVTGKAPYEGTEFLDILDKVRAGPPLPPSALAPGLAADLERIILMAMAPDPKDRFPTAAAFAEDLERVVQGRPVAAVIPRRRRPLRSWIAAAAALSLAAGAFLALRPRAEPVPFDLLEGARHDLDAVKDALYAKSMSATDFAARLSRAHERSRSALAAAPQLAVAHQRWGELQELRGRFPAARDAWEQALKLDPSFAAASYRLGSTLLILAYLRRLNLWEEPDTLVRSDADALARQAADALDAAGALGYENDLQRLLADAMRAFVGGNLERAAALADQGYASQEGRRGAEEFLWLRGLARKSAEDFDRALALRPRFALAAFSRGVHRQMAGRNPEAAADFSIALDASPDFAEARLHRGSVRAFSGDIEGAVRDFEALMDDPRLAAGAFNGRGWVRRRHGDPEGALADFDEAIRRRPTTNYLGYVYRAEARLERKDFAGAAEDARQAYSIRPWSWCLHLLIQARAGTRDWIAAENDLDALRVAPDDPARKMLASLRGTP
jgi:tetratricopeptide (TPR) repeat protein